MKQHEKLFMEALKASLNNQKVSWDFEISKDTWQKVFELAAIQKVLPLIFEAVYACPAIRNTEFEFYTKVKQLCVETMMVQIQKNSEFLSLYQKLKQSGINALVVKGIVCRELYPKPDLRVSADEDLLVKREDFEKSIDVLKRQGMRVLVQHADIKEADEIGLVSERGTTYLELHSSLFSNDWEYGKDLNEYFQDVYQRTSSVDVQGTFVDTMEPEMHLFYLICHAFKHFIHSGFGIRQVCDIIMFANVYGHEIDWQELLSKCRKIHADKFAAALFKIGKNYLNFDEAKAFYSMQWKEIEIDEKDLLLELLQSGIYGQTSMSRRHSSSMTLDAVEAREKGKRTGNGLRASLFPEAKKLEGKYTYLKKQPYLLPVAWGERILKYWKETAKMENSSAREAVKIGNQRVELLKKYGILEKE